VFARFFLLTLCLLAAPIELRSQNLAEEEASIAELRRLLNDEVTVHDSLKRMLDATAREIEREKNQTSPNEDRLRSMMSQALQLSGRIKQQQQRIRQHERQVEAATANLDRMYEALLDSLIQVKAVGQSISNDAVDVHIWVVKEKRLYLLPGIKRLSYDPQKVHALAPSSIRDSLEKSIVVDYLGRALKEVEDRIEAVRDSRAEYEELVRFRRKLSRFMDDVRDEVLFSPLYALSSSGTGDEGIGLASHVMRRQGRSIVDLLYQISARNPMLDRVAMAPDKETALLTIEEYLELLKEAERQLTSYATVIREKLR
jgi:hypothetical protein